MRSEKEMIHYHGLPISGSKKENIHFAEGRNLLIPFTAKDYLPLVADQCRSFCLDNGAYSMWKKGISVNWDDYVDWVRKWELHPRYSFALIPDVIDGSEVENKRLLLKYCKQIKYAVPIWHLHESFEYLSTLCHNFDKIAIGSSGEWKSPNSASWWARMKDVMSIVCDSHGRPRTRLHGLRMLHPNIVSKIPFHSADSCNAGVNAGSKSRFGTYMPTNSHHRAEIIANRIESVNSPAVFTGG